MGRSTRAERARKLNVARALLERDVGWPEAMRSLCRTFRLSARQAYRYLQVASGLDGPVQAAEVTVPITLKIQPRTAELLRRYAKSSGLTMGAVVTDALLEFLRTRKKHG